MEKIVTLNYQNYSCKVIVRDENEHIQRNWMNGRFYETQRNGLLNYIAANEKKGGKIIDIGASIGNHSLFFAVVMEAAELHCVEPSESWSHLADTLMSNEQLKNGSITLHNIALGEKPGKCQMQAIDERNVGMMQVEEGDYPFGVDIVPIDSCPWFEGYDFIKIDVEHYNEPLLIGAKETFTKGTGNIYIEAETDEVLAVTDKYMNEYGYSRVPGLVFNHTPTYKYQKNEN